MSKSTTEQIVYASRIVNDLDRKGKLVILRDLQKQGLEPKEIITVAAGVELITSTGAKVPVTYTEGLEV